jgi:hypothetical protein
MPYWRPVESDTYIKQEHLDRVDLLKLDIEGYELTALCGAEDSLKTRRIRAIYFEYFEKLLIRVAPPSKLIEFLDSLAYEVCFCRLCDIKRSSSGSDPYAQARFARSRPPASSGQGTESTGNDRLTCRAAR